MQELILWAERKKGSRNKLQEVYTDLCKSVDSVEKSISYHEEASDFFVTIAKVTQEKVIGYFENIVTSFLQSIYGPEYKLKIEFVSRRNKSECDLVLVKGRTVVSLKDECGGGIIDVVSFGLQLAVWSINRPRTDPVFIMDEPFKYVSNDRLPSVGFALKGLCKKLGIQLILVSHSNELIGIGESAFEVKQSEGASEVIELEVI